MFGTYFYNETIKRCVSVFGTLFNNIQFKKVKADGTVLSSPMVPLSYGPKQKFLDRLAEEPNLSDGNRSAISLPRMAFELTGFEYDVQRQQNKLIRSVKNTDESDGKRGFQYAPAPYNLNFTLSILTKNMNDALQIVEQILPYFQPEYTVTMKMVDSMTDNRDVPVVLNSVSFQDDYEGSFEDRRVIEYTLDFTMKTYFFGPVYTGNIIKNVVERTFLSDGNDQFTTTQINSSGLVKEVKHYEPAFAETSNAVSNSTTVTFATAINSKISVGDEVFGTGNSSNPTISSIANDKLSIVLSSAITVSANTKLKFVGSVDSTDTFVVAETVQFFDEGVIDRYEDVPEGTTTDYNITVTNSGSGNRYTYNGTQQFTFSLIRGVTYRFLQNDSTNSGHPLRFSTTSNGTHGGGSEYITGVTYNGTPGQSGAYTEIKVASDAPATLYYYCSQHSAMGGVINITG